MRHTLGIDPSLTCTGLCIVDAKGHYIESVRITTKNTKPLPFRILYIYETLQEYIKQYKSRYKDLKVGTELPITKMYNDDLLVMVKSVVWVVLMQHNLSFVTLKPNDIQAYMKDQAPQFDYSAKNTGTIALSKYLFERGEYTCTVPPVKLQNDESDAFMIARLASRFWLMQEVWNGDLTQYIVQNFRQVEIALFTSTEERTIKWQILL